MGDPEGRASSELVARRQVDLLHFEPDGNLPDLENTGQRRRRGSADAGMAASLHSRRPTDSSITQRVQLIQVSGKSR